MDLLAEKHAARLHEQLVDLLHDSQVPLDTVSERQAFTMRLNTGEEFWKLLCFEQQKSTFVRLLIYLCLHYKQFPGGNIPVISLIERIIEEGQGKIKTKARDLLFEFNKIYQQEEPQKEKEEIMATIGKYLIKNVKLAEVDVTALEFHVKQALTNMPGVNVTQKDGNTVIIVGSKALTINEDFLKKLQAFVIGKTVQMIPMESSDLMDKMSWDIVKALGLLNSVEVELIPEGISSLFN